MALPLPFRYAGGTALAVGAHPDDIELGLGGTMARLAHEGVRVVMAVASIPNDFDKRAEEARRGASILGAEFRTLAGGGCARVEDAKTYELVEKLDALGKELHPVAVFSHGPADFHKDHVLIYRACLETPSFAGADLFCYNPTSCRPGPFDFHPRVFVDITHTLELKMAAIDAHPSQFATRRLPTSFLRDVAQEHGRMAGVTYAEGLEVVRLQLLGPAASPAQVRQVAMAAVSG